MSNVCDVSTVCEVSDVLWICDGTESACVWLGIRQYNMRQQFVISASVSSLPQHL